MRVRSKQHIYQMDEPIQRARFVTAVDKNGQYPTEASGANVLPCRFARGMNFPKQSGSQILTQTEGSVRSWVYTGSWLPFGTYLSAIKLWGRWWAAGKPTKPDPMSIRKWDTNNRFLWGYAVENGSRGFRRVRISPYNGLIYALHYYSSSASSVTSGLYKLTTDGELIDNVHIPYLGNVVGAEMDMDIDNIDGSIVVAGHTKEYSEISLNVNQRLQSYDRDLVLNTHDRASSLGSYNGNSVKSYNGDTYITKVGEDPPGNGFPAGTLWNHHLEPSFLPPPYETFVDQYFKFLSRPWSSASYWTKGITVGNNGRSYGTCKDYVNVNGDPNHARSGSVIVWDNNGGVPTDVIKTSAAPLTSKSPIHFSNGYIWFIDRDVRLHKYDANTLTQVWSSEADQFGWPEDIASDASGNIYLTGKDRQAIFPDSPDNTWCIEPDGTPIWSHNITGDQHSIAVDQTTGEYYTSGQNAINLNDAV